MHSLIHAIALEASKCVGCTKCLQVCPTEAMRIKFGKAKILEERCINCGQCILVCPHNALYGITDDLPDIHEFKYKIALVDPVLYGQFHKAVSPSSILSNILSLGFNECFETSMGAEYVTKFTKEHLKTNKLAISSSCPTIVRLIQIQFHDLIDNILSIDTEVEISAQLAREKAMKSTGLSSEEIGIFYISPCSAKIYSFKKPVGIIKSSVDATLSIKSVFLEISKTINNNNKVSLDYYPSGKGIGFARSSGQSQALEITDYLSVDGIRNVISVLEEVEYKKINDVSFLECHACTNGCVGGCLNIENSFVASNRIKNILENNFSNEPSSPIILSDKYLLTEPLHPIKVMNLSDDLSEALQKMQQIEKVLLTLPNIDCGACGSPSCKSLAEDIVLGHAKRSDCVVILKKHVGSTGNER
ncbi:MAG: [Fe-Fe] hydrogenase large subunit C-terminal domain-containing protein [Alkaliphilus sp.]